MKIKIIGPEDEPAFKTSLAHLLKAIHELQANVVVDEITDLQDIEDYGPLLYPAIFINGRLAVEGRSISLEEAKRFIMSGEKNDSEV